MRTRPKKSGAKTISHTAKSTTEKPKQEKNQVAKAKKKPKSTTVANELSAARKSPLKRYCWYLIVCAYYFCALYVNEEIFGLNHKAFDESVNHIKHS